MYPLFGKLTEKYNGRITLMASLKYISAMASHRRARLELGRTCFPGSPERRRPCPRYRGGSRIASSSISPLAMACRKTAIEATQQDRRGFI